MNLKFMQQWLKQEEKFVSHVYKDSEGFDTIGIGRLVHAGKGGITLEEAQYLLNNDIARICKGLDSTIPFWRETPESVQHALIAMAFQMGVDGLAGFKLSLELIKTKRYPEARIELANSLWYKQTTNRAKRTIAMVKPDDEEIA